MRFHVALHLSHNEREQLRTGDGLSGRVLGMPALPSWLGPQIMRFALAPKMQSSRDAANIRSPAGVAVFLCRAEDPAAWVEAGRAYQRFALQAAAMEVRTAFINQLIEVRSLRPQFESWLNLRWTHATLMVRFGRGPKAPFSLRRPLEDVMVPGEEADSSSQARTKQIA